MARNGTGVDSPGGVVRIRFTFDGRRVQRVLTAGGKPMRATPSNLRHAERLLAEIRAKIKLGVFALHEYFPADPTHAAAGAFDTAAQLDHWLSAQRIESSTRAGYRSAIRFWLGTIGSVPLLALKHSDILRALATRPMLTGKRFQNYVSVVRVALARGVGE